MKLINFNCRYYVTIYVLELRIYTMYMHTIFTVVFPIQHFPTIPYLTLPEVTIIIIMTLAHTLIAPILAQKTRMS